MEGRRKNVFCLFLTIIGISAMAYLAMASIVLRTNERSRISGQQIHDFPRPRPLLHLTKVPNSSNPHLKNNMACNLPKLNPFEPNIRKYFPKPNRNVSCELNPKYPLLFETDFDNNLIALEDPIGLGFDNCCYKHILRPKIGRESKYWESPDCVPIERNVTKIPEDMEFISVLCETNETTTNMSTSRKLQPMDTFMFISIKPKMDGKVKGRTISISSVDSLSVVILGLDSISHMNFLRSMPNTHEYLTQNLSGVGMNGYVKVAENTFPNLVPVLTGLSEPELVESCWESNKVPFDNCSFIWSNFSARGYLTSFWENLHYMNTFNYRKEGFIDQPTDYYPRTLSIYQGRIIAHDGDSRVGYLCLGPRFNLRALLDNIEKMAWKMSNRLKPRQKYFQFHWDNSLAHGSKSLAPLGDPMILSTLKFLQDNGFLNHTVLILMSDHGDRLSYFRRTLQGKIEDRMPFLYFVLPHWFSKQYPKASRNLNLNRDRMTTPFDLHETLLDIMDTDEKISDLKIFKRMFELKSDEMSGKLPRGISLFLPVPRSRTCELAGISAQWCVCHRTIPISTEDKQVKLGVRKYMQFLRRLLKPYPECSPLHLHKILRAEIILKTRSPNFGISKKTDELMNIVLETIPGKALFEVTMRQKLPKKWVVSSDARINAYRNQSDCVWSIVKLKTYCYCKETQKLTTKL